MAESTQHLFSSRYAQIVLFGDSITQFGFSLSEDGWCAAVASHFQRRADIINRGFSGYNTRWAKALLPNIVDRDNIPHVIMIFFGANDAALNDHQHVPLSEYRANLEHMCHYLLGLGMPRSSIILITPPPADEEARKAVSGLHSDRTFAQAEQYARSVIEIGQKLQVDVVNLFDGLARRQDLSDCLIDGLHLSEKGNAVAGEMVITALEERLQGWCAAYPDWKDITVENFEKLFQKPKSNV